MSIDDTYYKYFLLNDGGSVYGVISETENTLTFDWLGNKGDGKFYPMGKPIHEAKRWLFHKTIEVTRDYDEAYRHMMSYSALRKLQRTNAS